MVTGSIRAHWEAAAQLIARTRDVLDARPGYARTPAGDGEPDEAPAPLVTRGWDGFLLALTDERLEAFEALGAAGDWADAPTTLSALVEEVRAVCALSPLTSNMATEAGRPARRREGPRKRAQIDAFVRLVVPLAERARRVVDVGSGHGHLTRAIAERVDAPVVGLERDVALAKRARGLSTHGAAVFTVTDVLRDGLPLRSGDCVLGLHACGELGDAMVAAVGAVEDPVSLALVGCCPQKRRAVSRAPLVSGAATEDALTLPRSLLGLGNLTPRDDGVEASRAENLAARRRRLALHRLLSARLGTLRLGAELDGLNRRAAHDDLDVLVGRAFALRGLRTPSASEVIAADGWAHAAHARDRRLALPRSLLANVLETFVALDRALYLVNRGFDVQVGTLFDAEASARNIAVAAEHGARRD
ncbi:MAG TPA: methyltransferase [Polyangiaceae bacterium]|jgi:SAM-dependent methyltransferase|nr:methyltransferase [Polyangiaceae bacterium]